MNVEQELSFTKEILHEDESVFIRLPGETKVEHLGKMQYDFNLKVRGWEKGSYFVVLRSGEKILLKLEFKV